MTHTSNPDPDQPAPASTLQAARIRGEACDWQGAYELFQAKDKRCALSAEELEFYADCTRWIGDHERVADLLERAHHAYATDAPGRARTALSLCYTHMDACQTAQAASWWQRADDLIRDLPEGPEHGLHAWFAGRSCSDSGDIDGQEGHAKRALAIAKRFDDRNVEALALIDLAHVATFRGHSTEALALLDQATALALGGEIGVLESGLVFCNAIMACRSRGDWDRAEEWTRSANRWVQRVRVSYFPGLCRVHRAEVLRIRGELLAAETEALEARRLLSSSIPRWTALAHIELGEIRRRRGDLPGALSAFRACRELGVEPQPGLGLVLLAQGDPLAAHRAIERFWRGQNSTLFCFDRTNIMRARVTIAIAASELSTAESAYAELALFARDDALRWDQASSAQALGELQLARGDADAAIASFGQARSVWAELDAPYELGLACMKVGRALLADGDPEVAALEFETARGIFDRLGARLDREHAGTALTQVSEADPQTVEPAKKTAALRKEGEYWTFQFDGQAIRVRDGRGPQYLAELLANPGHDRLALDLAHGPESPIDSSGSDEVLDGEARAAYRTRIAELQSDLAEAELNHDEAQADRCRAELDTITNHLSTALGLGGRARRLGNSNERARQSVTKAIRTTIRKLSEEHQALGRYLSNTIRTGTTCRFDPDPSRPMTWAIDGGS